MPDLPRRRRLQRPSWTEPFVQRLTPTIKALVITNLILFLAFVFVRSARAFIVLHLAMGPAFWHGELWQPVTAMFVHVLGKPSDGLWFLMNLLGLWFIGAFLEARQGRRRFLALYLAAGILSNLAMAGVSRLLAGGAGIYSGCSLAVLALFVAIGRLQGREPTQFFGGLVLQTRLLAWILVGWAILVPLLDSDWPALVGALTAGVVGYLGAAPGGLRDLLDVLRVRRLKRRYRVLEGGAGRRTRSPKYWN